MLIAVEILFEWDAIFTIKSMTRFDMFRGIDTQNPNVSANYTNPGYGLSLVDTLWNAGSYRQPLEQEGNPMT